MHLKSLLVTLAFVPLAVYGQGAIDTNRPGFTSTTAVVKPGQWQLETGLDYTHGNGSERSWSIPVAEIRVGVAAQTELFLNSITWGRQESDQGDNSGLKDMALGVKYRMTGEDAGFSTALLGQLSVPVGDKAFSSDRWDPTLGFVWASNGLPISGTIKASKFKPGYQLDNGLKWVFSARDSTVAFLEWEANLPEHGDDTHWLNIGWQLISGQNMQVDLNGGAGLNNATADYRIGAGFSYRF